MRSPDGRGITPVLSATDMEQERMRTSATRNYTCGQSCILCIIKIINVIVTMGMLFASIVFVILLEIGVKGRYVSYWFLLVFTVSSLITLISSDYRRNAPLGDYLLFMKVPWAKELLYVFICGFFLPSDLICSGDTGKLFVCSLHVMIIISTSLAFIGFILGLVFYCTLRYSSSR